MSERTIRESEGAQGALAAERTEVRARENARRLSSILTQTASVIETSAALAEANAERLERTGRADAGAEERRVAEWAREAAQRARIHAETWREFALRGSVQPPPTETRPPCGR
jgi:uncharacterized protein